MKSRTRYIVWVLGFLSFVYVTSGGALFFHLVTQEHDHDKHNKHDSNTCYICQSLTVLNKKILVEAPLLLPELLPTEFNFSYSSDCFIYQDTPFPLLPRAPPA